MLKNSSTNRREQKRPSYTQLIFNHVDAWQVATIIAALALLLHDAVTPATFMLLPAIGTGYWLAFALNDYFDAPFDATDQNKANRNFFVNYSIQPYAIRILFGGITTLLLIIFAQFGRWGISFLGLSYFAMWAYSAPPLRLKNKPGFDLLMHTLFVQTYPYILCLTLIRAEWTRLDIAIVAIVFLASLTAQIEQQVRDYETDRQHERNFTILAGITWSLRILKGITAVLIVTAFIFVITGTIPWFLLPFGIISLPAMLHRFLRKDSTPRSERLVVISTTIGFLYTGLIFCYFLIRAA
ncbi:MAG: UbiA family prenyltransferase [Chloroflexi bacterium]|nr:UbiA family prenyltransferase [Chloroflexota bacterium]